MFLKSPADIVIFGGAAGVGKTWGLLLDPLRHVKNSGFTCVTFRQTSPQVRNPGGLLDKSLEIYPILGAELKETKLEWTFPSGALHKFSYLQYETDVLQWQGTEVAQINFDELTHFKERMFFYMLSRNRSLCGVKPCVRATVNPDADSWVAKLIAWWINQDTGLPIPQRSGVVRYFLRINEVIEWADTKDQLFERYREYIERAIKDSGGHLKPDDMIKSLTFIPGSVYDNKKLIATNPQYLANLLALPLVERERLLGGNWKIRATAGKIFNRDWFKVIGAHNLPTTGDNLDVVFWDFAATEKELAKDDPDYTAGVHLRFIHDRVGDTKTWVILDVVAIQANPAEVEKVFKEKSAQWREAARSAGARFKLRWEEEPGSASKRESARLIRVMAGYDARGLRPQGDKFERAKALAIQAEHGNVRLLKGDWNDAFVSHMHNQPETGHDDIMDGASGAFNSSINNPAQTKHGKSIYN